MPLEKPRLDGTLLIMKGQAGAAPVKEVKEGVPEGLSSLGQRKTQTVTVTYRLDPERHLQLKRTALDNGTSIQMIIDHALKQIGL